MCMVQIMVNKFSPCSSVMKWYVQFQSKDFESQDATPSGRLSSMSTLGIVVLDLILANRPMSVKRIVDRLEISRGCFGFRIFWCIPRTVNKSGFLKHLNAKQKRYRVDFLLISAVYLYL